MATNSFDIAVGMSQEAYSNSVHIFTVTAEYILSQEQIDTMLHEEQVDS